MSCYYTSVKFGKHLKELRLHLCQTSAASKGVREFIETQYVALKKSNPKFPILVRECSGVEPKLYARYDVFVYYPCRCPRNRSPSKIPPLCLPLGRLKGYMNSDASTVVKDKEYGKENVLQLSGKSSAQVLDSIKLLNDAKL